ncbi:hypothetical protein N825_10485 [Skermanella stibiiresistens SB22]|uniref:Transposase (putative) YhgA-like domain-containing protein n=1 Tax=Skermanella stibiiresistens SB22 TaxID=1385369 RepID=W9H2M4_9PROT|nr:Rpn family recombination-promoting nuclease/putative transposase [Skermanella stibiiresistens]EWY38962.1 hypothetical protein N825_10485 [Skermanella stibiiresistens SB22]
MADIDSTDEANRDAGRLIRRHDQFVKLILDGPGNADSFLRERLPPGVTAHLTAEPAVDRSESFVDPLLAELCGDRVYGLELSGGRPLHVLTLIEHKSAGEGDALMQVFGYLHGAATRGARRVAGANGGFRVAPAPVLAVILYHGTAPWPHPPTLGDAYGIPPDILAAGPLDFGYTLVDLSVIPDAELSRHHDLQAGLLTLKYATRDGDPEVTLERLLGVAAVIGLTVLRGVVRYLFMADDARNQARLRAALGHVVPGQEDEIMPTIAESYIAEGHAKGLAEGQIKAKADILLRMLQRRNEPVPAVIERKLPAASADEIDRWIDAVVDGASLEQVFGDSTH